MSECLISDIQHQNVILNSFIEKNNTEYGKYEYLLQQTQTIHGIQFYLFLIYFSVFFIYVYVLLFGSSKLSIYMKFGLLSIFIIYPFFITSLEMFLWNLWKYIYDTTVGNVFILPDY
jgi:hypothetical protein